MPPKKAASRPPTLERGTPKRPGSRKHLAREAEVAQTPQTGGREPSESPPVLLNTAVTGTGLTPRPQRVSTNYGAPVFTGKPAYKPKSTAYVATDLWTGLKRVQERVEEDNRRDEEERGLRDLGPNFAESNKGPTEASRKRTETDPPATESQRQKRQRTDQNSRPAQPSPEAQLEVGGDPAEDINMSDHAELEAGIAENRRNIASRSRNVLAKGPKRSGQSSRHVTRSRRLSSQPPQASTTIDSSSRRTALSPSVVAEAGESRPNDEVHLVRPYDDNSPEIARPETPTATAAAAPAAQSLQSSVAQTERSFNMESVLFQTATVQTPQPTTPTVQEAEDITQPLASASSPVEARIPDHGGDVPPATNDPQPEDPEADIPEPDLRGDWRQTITSAAPGRGGILAPAINERPLPKPFPVTHPEQTVRQRRSPPLEDPHPGMRNQKSLRNRLLPPDPRPTDDISNFFMTTFPSRMAALRAASVPASGPVLLGGGPGAEDGEAAATVFPPKIKRNLLADAPHRQPADEEADPSETSFGKASLQEWMRTRLRPSSERPARQTSETGTGDPTGHSETQTSGHAGAQSSENAGSRSNRPDDFADLHKQQSRSRLRLPTFHILGRALQALGLVFASYILLSLIFGALTGPRQFEGVDPGSGFHWYGTDWRSNLGQFIPRSPFNPISLRDDQYSNLLKAWKNHNNAINRLKKTDEMHDAALAKLNKALPKIIRLDTDRKGQPMISPEFWHALKDLARQDDDMLTLVETKNGKDISDLEWKAINKRMKDGGVGDGRPPPGVEFESWLRGNDQRVREILRLSPGHRLRDKEVEDIVRRHVGQETQRLMMKDDFLAMLKSDFKARISQVQAETGRLQKQVDDVVKRLADLAAKAAKSPPVSKDELRRIAQMEVRREIGDLQLNSLANGRVGQFYDAELADRVNFFGVRSGAVISVGRSSPTYKPVRARLGSKEWHDRSNRPFPPMNHAAVLQRWEDDGDCWCAGIRNKTHSSLPADVAIMLDRLVPLHLVVEHISPHETVDPGAMPREIEVWAEVEDEHYGSGGSGSGSSSSSRPSGSGAGAGATKRQVLADWSLSKFPDTDARHPLLAQGFVMIGRFTFDKEDAVARRGKKFGFPPELAGLDAATDHILVRAVDNYGAEDHTCFYRLRLYGEPRPFF